MPKRIKRGKHTDGPSWRERVADRTRTILRRVRMFLWIAAFVAFAAVLFGVAIGLDRLKGQVAVARLQEFPEARIEFVDLPAPLRRYASDDLFQSVADELLLPWAADDACRRIADRIRAVGWVERLKYVRREPDGRFLVACDYRIPIAMVRHAGSNYLIDRAGVRVPGVYGNTGSAPLIERVVQPPPPPGQVWPGDDVQAGLTMLRVLGAEPFLDQIAAIDVGNLGGRIDGAASHIELATDQDEGRIRWGSIPGGEVEENAVDQKLALLRANYRDTGRADAHHPVIDISTFPDRFAVPGR